MASKSGGSGGFKPSCVCFVEYCGRRDEKALVVVEQQSTVGGSPITVFREQLLPKCMRKLVCFSFLL
jgi:hypothetical protein